MDELNEIRILLGKLWTKDDMIFIPNVEHILINSGKYIDTQTEDVLEIMNNVLGCYRKCILLQSQKLYEYTSTADSYMYLFFMFLRESLITKAVILTKKGQYFDSIRFAIFAAMISPNIENDEKTLNRLDGFVEYVMRISNITAEPISELIGEMNYEASLYNCVEQVLKNVSFLTV